MLSHGGSQLREVLPLSDFHAFTAAAAEGSSSVSDFALSLRVATNESLVYSIAGT